MTSSILIDGSKPTPRGPERPRRDRSEPTTAGSVPDDSRLALSGVLRSERIKLLSLRSIRLTLFSTVLVGLVLSALLALLMSGEVGPQGMLADDPAGHQAFLLMVATFTAPFLALVFGVLGVFAIGSEYSSGMILSTLAAVPRRSPVFVAKGLVTAAVAAITALLLVVGGLAVAVAFLPAAAPQLAAVGVLSGALGTVAYLVCITLFSFGVAGLLRSIAGGIAVVAGVTFVLPVAFQVFGLTGWEWVPAVSNYLPASLGSTLSQGVAEATSTAGPNFGAALGAMLAWVAVILIPAAIAFTRRDARSDR